MPGRGSCWTDIITACLLKTIKNQKLHGTHLTGRSAQQPGVSDRQIQQLTGCSVKIARDGSTFVA